MRLLSLVLAAASALLAFVPAVSAQTAGGVTISPPRFEYTVEPGQVVRDQIQIINSSLEPLTLSSSVRDFVAGGESGEPSFVDDPTKVDSAISISSWITVSGGDSITIPAGGKRAVDFTIAVPAGAEPGGKYGAIFFSPPAGEGQVAVQQRIGSLVILRVGGDISESGRLDRFGPYDSDLESIADASRNFFYFSRISDENPVSFAIRYENTGTVHVKPTGRIELSNFGIKLSEVGVQTVLNNQGLEVEKNIVDFIPVNTARGNVLSKSFRTFRADFPGFPSFVTTEQGIREIAFGGFPVGLYTATLTLDPVAGNPAEVHKVRFVVFPAVEILGSLLLLAALGFGFVRYRRYSQRRLEEEFKKKFGVNQ